MLNIRPARTHRFAATVLGTLVSALLVAPWASAQAPGVAPAVTVFAGKATSVGDRSARLEFRAAPAANEEISVVVYYGEKDGGTEASAWEHKTEEASRDEKKGRNDYAVTLENLSPETAYSYRVCVRTAAGEVWSDVEQFTTLAPAPPWYVGTLILLGVLAMLVGPFAAGGWLARQWRMPDYGWKIGLVLFSVVCGCVVTYVKWPPSLGPDLSGGVILVYEMEGTPGEESGPEKEEGQEGQEGQKKDDRQAESKMDDLVQAIQLRVNPGGTREVTVRKYGPKQIEITIPRANPEEVRRIKEKIVNSGSLEFRIVANERDHRTEIEAALATQGSKVFDRDGKRVLGWWVPVTRGREGEFEGDSKIIQRVVNLQGQRRLEVFIVNDEYNVTGAYLQSCTPDKSPAEGDLVRFTFNSRGGRQFGYLTDENKPDEVEGFFRKLGIILDNQLYSAPWINDVITTQGQISGGFTQESARDLADVLNAGSLPTSLKKEPISEMSTGPTLGRDMIRSSTISLTLSMVLVLVFMAVYYRFAGLVACGALLVNLLLMLAIMILVKADFSLPGLAGFVLTVGMAVDANVLIYERMREELARDAALRMAIRNGFSRALSAIVDSNLTTIITGVILWWVGTTQIKGFAIVLILGIAVSMFTAIFCSRVVFDIAERRRWITKLRMMQIIGVTRIDFVSVVKPAVAASVVVILVGLAASFHRGRGLLDIDFTGGESVVVLFKKPYPIGDVRRELEDLPDLTVADVQLYGEDAELRFVINTSEKPDLTLPENRGLSATGVIERHIHRVFGDKLATNEMTIGKVAPIAGESAEEKPEAKKPAEEKPEAKEQSRAGLPPATLLASTDPAAVLLAQAEPVKKEESKPPAEVSKEPPAKQPEPKPEAKPELKPEAKPEPKPEPKEGPKPEGKAGSAPAAEPATKSKAPTAPPVVEPLAGGTEAELLFNEPQDQETLTREIENRLSQAGLSTPMELTHVEPGPGSTDSRDRWLLRIKLPEGQLRELVLQPLEEKFRQTPYFPASSSIGSRVAGDMQKKAIYALLGSVIAVVIYLWIRFQQVVYGVAAVIASVHDVLVMLMALAVSVYLAPVAWFLLVDPFKISLTVLAAFLTVFGYSLNDTIVVFDRIREIRGKSPRLTAEMINTAVNQTLSRTLLTFWLAFLVVLVLYIGGGQAIRAFSFSMLVGLIAGTYSSVFIAAPILLWMGKPASKSS